MATKAKSRKTKEESEPKAAATATSGQAGACEVSQQTDILSVEGLKWVGSRLHEKPFADRRLGPYKNSPEASCWREYLMCALLRIRGKSGHLRKLELNRAQRDLERTSSHRNIVLKARQLGITTYVAARFFMSCITREGTLSVQVAHDQRSAEEIFRIVHRLLDNLPAELRKDALVTSRANVRQIVFPVFDSEYRVETAADPNAGRGLTIHNLHCSEVARWRAMSRKRWPRYAPPSRRKARSILSQPPTERAEHSTRSGNALRKRVTRATSIPGGGIRRIDGRCRSKSSAMMKRS